MKHLFKATATKPTHVRTSDGATGVLREFPDNANTWGSPQVNPDDFAPITPPAPAVPIPYEVTNWRAKAVLEIAGLLPSVEAALTAMPGDAGIVARNAWESGAALARHGPTVTALATQLSLSAEQVDAMFLQAAALQV